MVKRLRHRPFTAVTGVRFPYGSPKRKATAKAVAFLFWNDVCLRANDVGCANDVHFVNDVAALMCKGKHRIIAKQHHYAEHNIISHEVRYLVEYSTVLLWREIIASAKAVAFFFWNEVCLSAREVRFAREVAFGSEVCFASELGTLRFTP